MRENDSNYRLLEQAEARKAADVLLQAFADDPLYAFLVPPKQLRLPTLAAFFQAYSELNTRYRRGYGRGEPLEGVAFWQMPGQARRSINGEYLCAFLPLVFSLYPFVFLRLRRVSWRLQQLRDKYAPEPHFYLDYIGVLPAFQGKGVASRLLRPMLHQADCAGLPVYTDTNERTNLGLYEHFGFRCMEECRVRATGVTIWALRRPVGAQSRA
jgi:ribosomal protein S18 acetylase RimI-like enzyme